MWTHIVHFLLIFYYVILFVTICQSVSVDKSSRRSARSPSSPLIPSSSLSSIQLSSSSYDASSFPLPSSSSSSPTSSSSSSSIVNEMQASKPLEPPRIIEHPSDIVVKNNEPAMLYCKADGQPKPTIEWYKDGEKVRPGRPRIFISGDGLFFYKVVSGEGKDSDTGIYYCIARNQIGKVYSRNATVNVGYLRDDFRLIPKSDTVIAGDSVTLDCSPPRGSPEPSVTWKKDGEPMMTLMASPRFQLTTSGSLKINDIHPTDRGIYVCEATNSVGSRESAPASLVVLVKPYFIKIPNNITTPELSTIEFECKVDGDPVPQITWTKKDGKLSSTRSTIKPDKTLRLVNVTLEDEGVYLCEAGNHVASAVAAATLTIANGFSATGGGGGGGVEPALYHSIAKEPYFIVGAILLMFILCSIIMIVFARQHLGWKKAVGAYITVQLSKADELEKARHLNNTCSSKNSWLLETTTSAAINSPGTTTGLLMGGNASGGGNGSASKSFISSELRKGSSYLHHSSPTPPPSNSSSVRIAGSLFRDCDNTKGGYRKGGFGGGEIKPFNPSLHHYHDHLTTNTSTNLESYPSIEEGYYAEVEGYSSLVTFGKKDSLTTTATSTSTSSSSTTVPGNIVNQNNLINNTKSISSPATTSKATIIEPMAPSIEPYATTNLINTYHHPNYHHQQQQQPQQYLEHRACDQNNYHHLNQQQQSSNYYGLPLTVTINGSSGNIVNSPSLSQRYPIYHQLHNSNTEHINNYHNHSPLSTSNRSTITNNSNNSTASTPTPGSGYRKVILKDSRSKDHQLLKNNRKVLITDDLYAIPNCGPDDLDDNYDDNDDDLDHQHIRPPSANFFLPNT
ncbi:uncharacterized protein LOC128396610 [Panonychus citri]|uniref:uncharacterized protein LOC128396610 n=1 Tax=Panonychus citri TaxID=50023 RepID=UPI00230829BC|nr:uncharacterized protein LOC128396610 [Panonychus citri]